MSSAEFGELRDWLLPDLHEPAVALATAEPAAAPPPAETDPRPDPAEAAYAAGHAAGVEAGAAAARAELAPTVAALQGLLGELATTRALFLDQLERNLHALALGVARKLIQRELTADPELVLSLIREALQFVPLEQAIEVRLHPDDHAIARAALGGADAAGVPAAVQWRPDPALARGSFVIDTPQCIVDGRTDVALRTLYDWLGQ